MAKPHRKRRPAETEENDGSLARAAYNRIKLAILTSRLRGGDYLNVARLCEELELGRSPVHQAVHRLALEGLVEILPRKGVVIRAGSLEDFLQIAEARALLAPALSGMAARRADRQAITRLERLLASLKSSRRDREAALVADLAFHEQLFTAAGNAVLAQMALRLHERALRFLYLPQRGASELVSDVDRLRAVLLAVRSGDEEGAQSEMRQYVEAASAASDSTLLRGALS